MQYQKQQHEKSEGSLEERLCDCGDEFCDLEEHMEKSDLDTENLREQLREMDA